MDKDFIRQYPVDTEDEMKQDMEKRLQNIVIYFVG